MSIQQVYPDAMQEPGLSNGMVMNDHSAFIMLAQPCDDAVEWLSRMVSQAGLSVLRTFDLQTARQAQAVCPCPHHGTDQCDCQMVVLLVYHDRTGTTGADRPWL